MSKVVISLSGGLDSAVLLSKLLTQGDEVFCVSFQYGSKHNPYEKEAARKLASYYKANLFNIDLAAAMGSFKSHLLLGQGEIPVGHYEEESMRQTVVPGRNLIFLSLLAGFAQSIDAEQVAIGVHAGDHVIYPDCRPEFLEAAGQAIYISSSETVTLNAPFRMINKEMIVRCGVKYGTPFELTRTCYMAQEVACGRCGSCCERREAFMLAGVPDPIPYDYTGPLPSKPR
jgi:7-cyano-7-deazaguanine synthase